MGQWILYEILWLLLSSNPYFDRLRGVEMDISLREGNNDGVFIEKGVDAVAEIGLTTSPRTASVSSCCFRTKARRAMQKRKDPT